MSWAVRVDPASTLLGTVKSCRRPSGETVNVDTRGSEREDGGDVSVKEGPTVGNRLGGNDGSAVVTTVGGKESGCVVGEGREGLQSVDVLLPVTLASMDVPARQGVQAPLPTASL